MKSPRTIDLLPEEIYLKILEIGVQNSILSHKDLCSLSLCSTYFNKLSKENSLWSILQTLDFPSWFSPPIQPFSSQKSLYRSKVDIYVAIKKNFDLLRVSRLDWELEVVGRRIKRIKRELKWINVQMLENSGELLDMIKDRYVVCHRKLAKVTKKHANIEKEVSSAVARIVNKDGYVPPFHDANVIVYRKPSRGIKLSDGSSKDESEDSSSGISETEIEESSEYESENVWDRPADGR
ncbi:hypothetical protein ACHQM5_006632 [Ranunculus cassubicifolius]